MDELARPTGARAKSAEFRAENGTVSWVFAMAVLLIGGATLLVALSAAVVLVMLPAACATLTSTQFWAAAKGVFVALREDLKDD